MRAHTSLAEVEPISVAGRAFSYAEEQVKRFDTAQSLDEAFPAVEPGLVPFGSRVLVQIRLPPKRTPGGVLLTDDSRDTEKWNTQVAKVRALGPVAFHHRDTLEPWPEGAWCQDGDFVRVPKYGGDRWEIPFGASDDERALFVLFNDLDIVGKVLTDPRLIKAYL